VPGLTLILLRGLSREAAHWGLFLPALAAAMPDAPIVALDLPGTGSRLPDRAPSTMAETMESVRAERVSRVTPGAPLLLFGLSLGGMVALEWAAQHPAEVAGLVVAASSAPDVSPFWRRIRPRALAVVATNMLARDPARNQARVARLVLNRHDLRDEAIRSWTEIEQQRPVSRATLRAQLTAAGQWRAPQALHVPALFLVGQADRFVHPDCTRRLAARYKAPVVEHPDAGHDLTTDAAEWVASELARFRRGLLL
jgi:pimeloyl-ACP methyl ester carboxylesterase